MKLVTFVHDGSSRVGALEARDGRPVVVDLQRIAPDLPADMLALLERGPSALALALDRLPSAPAPAALPLSDVTLQAPLPQPGKIICVGLNYRDHAAESNMPLPEVPTIFSKYANSVIGPGAPIVLPRVSNQVDYEGELAVVIGRRGRHIPQAEAFAYVAGYTAFNDVSARDYQMRTGQWTIGKTFDSFAPMGPALVTAAEIPDPHDLDLRVTVSGELLQASNTRHLIFGVPQLLAYLSQVMTLEPGDVIATGTPAGVGFARQPPRFLRPGDVVEVEIERVGRLVNPVVEEE